MKFILLIFLLNQYDMQENKQNYKSAYFGGGCFWCIEAVFENINGVIEAISGYAGGWLDNPTYEQVCAGFTGHAEVVKIVYNPDVISYDELLDIFFQAHDPTTLNRQGADIGHQYRSIILYENDLEKKIALNKIQYLEQQKVFASKIVTEIVKLNKFYPAEEYHQNYYYRNPYASYCQFVIAPKLNKTLKIFNDKIKK